MARCVHNPSNPEASPPLLFHPKLPMQKSYRFTLPKKVKVYEYFALGDGKTYIFTDRDQLPEYRGSGILDPSTVSFYNLFINGVLQPKENYRVSKGKLILKTDDAPVKNAVIILQMVKIT